MARGFLLIVFALFGLVGFSGFAQKIDMNNVWSGTWVTEWDTGEEVVNMTLKQTGSKVVGTYEYNGGKISGNFDSKTKVLTGTWSENEGSGWIRFVLQSDGKSFTGIWGDSGEDDPAGTWNGEKSEDQDDNLPPQPPAIDQGDDSTPSSLAYPEFDTGKSASYLTAEEKLVLYYVNYARAKPAEFADKFLYQRRKEGAYAEEAYQEFKKAKGMVVLKPSKVLTSAATYHVKDQGPTGKTGHDSSNGMTMSDRIEKYGKWNITIGENISYGYNGALDIVLQLIIDDGVTSRGHRKNIMNPSFKFVGTNIGKHAQYRFMCVQDFAGGINE